MSPVDSFVIKRLIDIVSESVLRESSLRFKRKDLTHEDKVKVAKSSVPTILKLLKGLISNGVLIKTPSLVKGHYYYVSPKYIKTMNETVKTGLVEKVIKNWDKLSENITFKDLHELGVPYNKMFEVIERLSELGFISFNYVLRKKEMG